MLILISSNALAEKITPTPSQFAYPKSSLHRSFHLLCISPRGMIDEEEAYLKHFAKRSLSNRLQEFKVILTKFGVLFHWFSFHNNLLARHSFFSIFSSLLYIKQFVHSYFSVLITHRSRDIGFACNEIVVP